jgi:acylglycerol lipase
MRAALLGLLAVASCAKTPFLPVRLDPSPPAGSTTEIVTAPDGAELFARHWAPADSAPKALVVIMHGLKDHSARYADFATHLAAAGYSVYAFDLRGHGRSAGKRVAPEAWWSYVDDLDRFLSTLETREPGRPIFVFGHSMGGAIAAGAAIQHTPTIAGLVLSGAALALDAPPLLLAATRMSGVVTPGFAALRLPNGDFSSAPGAKAAMDADPLVSQPAAPARTAAGLVDGISAIWEGAHALTMPVLALHGTKDKLNAPAGSRLFVERIPSTDKTLRIYDGYYHDLLHEPGGDAVEADVIAWIDAHAGGPPVTPPAPYTGRLAGQPRGWTQAVALGAGLAFLDDGLDFAGELGVRVARPRPLGWHAGLTARWIGDFRIATLAPAGIAFRFGDGNVGGVVGVATGGSVLSGGSHVAIPATAWLEFSFGPAHWTAAAELSYRVGDAPLRDGPLSSDVAWAGVALRYGGNRAYWPHTFAGVGPVLMGGVTEIGGIRAWTATLGLQLYGAD